MKALIILALFTVTFLSCSTPTHDGATAVCECYKELHRVNPEEVIQMEFVADSCKKLHVSVLEKFNENPEEKKVFNKAYEHCQNEK